MLLLEVMLGGDTVKSLFVVELAFLSCLGLLGQARRRGCAGTVGTHLSWVFFSKKPTLVGRFW